MTKPRMNSSVSTSTNATLDKIAAMRTLCVSTSLAGTNAGARQDSMETDFHVKVRYFSL